MNSLPDEDLDEADKAARLHYLARPLRAWPFVERRREVQRYHLVGDRRRSALDRFDLALGLELPDPAHTWRFHLVIAITSVLVISIASITAESMPQNLLLVPAWALYVLGLLSYRNYRLSTAS